MPTPYVSPYREQECAVCREEFLVDIDRVTEVKICASCERAARDDNQ